MKQSTSIKFKSGMDINVIGHGKGRVTGNVGFPTPTYVRVQFESGDIRDFLPRKLADKLVAEHEENKQSMNDNIKAAYKIWSEACDNVPEQSFKDKEYKAAERKEQRLWKVFAALCRSENIDPIKAAAELAGNVIRVK